MSKKLKKTPEIKSLIALGKEKGVLTYDDLNNNLPDEMVKSEVIDELIIMLNNMNIEILDTSKGGSQQGKQQSDNDEEEVKGIEVEFKDGNKDEDEGPHLDLSPGAVGKTDDPVRLYLKEMGTIPLLNREGEVVIAKRIEAGQSKVTDVLMHSPFIVLIVLSLGKRISRGKIYIRDAVCGSDEDFDELS